MYYAAQYRHDYGDPPAAERYRTDVDEARQRVQRLLPILRQDWRVLEVGAGSGAFLKAIEPYVAEVAGVEPDERAAAWMAEHLKLQVETRIEEAGASRAFDVIVMLHVLEHLPDPVAYLRGLRRVLKPLGRVVIEVPSVDDALIAIYRVPAYVDFYFQKAHLYYYNRNTLATVLARAGLHADIKGIQRYDLSNHLRWMQTGQPGGHAYYNSVLGPAVARAYAEALIGSGHSDTLWAIACLESANLT